MDRDRKKWLHSIGVCVNCKSTDAYTMAGRWLCYDCSEKERERQSLYRVEHRQEINHKQSEKRYLLTSAGKCRRCGEPSYNGTTFCKKHLYAHRDYRQKSREKNKPEYQEGKCLWCDNNVLEGKCFCQNCLDRKREIISRNRKKSESNHPWYIDTKIILAGGNNGTKKEELH